MDSGPDLDNRAGDTFPEARFIADFLEIDSVGDENDLVAEDLDAEDGACLVSTHPEYWDYSVQYSPYFSARAFKEAHVLAGLTSKMFPSRGSPGG